MYATEITETGDYYIWAQTQQNVNMSRKTPSIINEPINKKKVTLDTIKPTKPENKYTSNTDIKKSSRFSLFGLFSTRNKLNKPTNNANKSKLTVAKLSTPTYYMRNLQFNFRLEQDDNFSKSYKEHFHKNWIDLRFNSNIIKIKAKDVHFRKVELPPVETEKLTVVLNLDETLVSCCKDLKGDATIDINYKGKEIKVF